MCSTIGWIKRSGEAAICVPNRLIVEIRGQDKINTIDSVAR
ncbi:MAG: NusG domain II-containing protein [Spirochaetes bacterium]|nr:NusG domain II-containing protein [Spirochaetota bacterium]